MSTKKVHSKTKKMNVLRCFVYYGVFIFAVSTFPLDTNGQSVVAMLPVGLNNKIYETIPTKQLPFIDSTVLKQNDERSLYTKEQYIGYDFKTDYSPSLNDAAWSTYSNDYRSWHLKLRSPGAYGIALIFSKIKLLAGEKLFIYNLKGMYSFDKQTIPQTGVLPLDFLEGDEVVVEFDTPTGSREIGTFTIETVSHAYRNIFSSNNVMLPVSGQSQRKEAIKYNDCYVCLEGDILQQSKRAVVKLTIHYNNATKVCTGTLVNNTLQDKRPYILTAQHCISNQAEAERTVFTFNYEYLSCSGPASANNLTLNGSTYLASRYENDFSLVQLNSQPAYNYHPYYAGWSISDDDTNYVMSIHHPQGGPKKISIFQGTVTPHDFDDQTPRAANAFWRISRWDAGTTEGGSSGAPLFNTKHFLIGTLTGGSSTCESPVNDYFQCLSQSWRPSININQQLMHWLDPTASGITSVKGLDPFEGITPTCNTISNVQADELPGLIPYSPGYGYYSGYNANNIASYAEKFYTTDEVVLTGAFFGVGSINKKSPGGILVAVHENNQGIPGSSLFETYVPYANLDSGGANYVPFDRMLTVLGTFFISYTISYSPEDVFALLQSPWRNKSDSTAFVKLAGGWSSIKTISPVSMGASFQIDAVMCKSEFDVIAEKVNSFTIYPNPSSSIIIIKFQTSPEHNIQPQIIDLQGRECLTHYYQSNDNVLINTSELTPGIYILRFQINDAFYHAKFYKI